MKTRLATIICLIYQVIPFTGWGQNFTTINKTVTVVHFVEDTSEYSDRYIRELRKKPNSLPQNVNTNNIQRFVRVKNLGKRIFDNSAEAVIQEEKIPNKILNYIYNEDKEGNVDLNRVLQRASAELTNLNIDRAKFSNLTAIQKADLDLANRTIDANYLLAYFHYGIKKIDETEDSTNIRKGYRMVQRKYLFKVDFSEDVLNFQFYENGWPKSTDNESISAAKAYRLNMDIPIVEEKSETTNPSGIWKPKPKEGEKKKDGSKIGAALDIGLAAAQGKKGKVQSATQSIVDNQGEYNDDRQFRKLLADVNPANDWRNFTQQNVTISQNRAVVQYTKPIRINVGEKQGLRTNHRYIVKRTFRSKKTGVEKEKVVGTILATTKITKNARGVGNTQNTSKFIQTFGRKIKEFDKVYSNRVFASFYLGGGTEGLAFTTDFYLRGLPFFKKLKYGQKIYFDVNYQFDDNSSSLSNPIIVNGENRTPNVSVSSFGLGLAKEWYFLKRFIFGPYAGGRFYIARFRNSDVEEQIVQSENIDRYGWDLAFEVGARFGIRITKNFSIIASGSFSSVDFNDPFVSNDALTPIFSTEGGRFPLEGYDTNFDFTIRYELSQFNKK